MTSLKVILSTGRTLQQGISLEKGKYSNEYSNVASTLLMDPEDMKELKVLEGDKVKIKTENGEIVLRVKKSPDVPHPGIIFLPYGPWGNALIGSNTNSQGMPDYKNIVATIEKTDGALVKLGDMISKGE